MSVAAICDTRASTVSVARQKSAHDYFLRVELN